MQVEKERKWLIREDLVEKTLDLVLNYPPQIPLREKKCWAEHTYLESSDGRTVRVTKHHLVDMQPSTVNYEYTVKENLGVPGTNFEIVVKMQKEQYDSILKSKEFFGKVQKFRLVVPDIRYISNGESAMIEIDVYRGANEGLAVVEVESFNGFDVADYEPPDWFGEEITDDLRYANVNLAKNPYKTWSSEKND